jgi:fatty-acyl-CoA synthase
MSQLSTNLVRRVAVGDFLKRSALRSPEKTALVFRNIRWTYRELNQRVNRFAHSMAQIGVLRGDRVAIMSHNCPQFLICFLGLAKIGAVITPLNFSLKEKEIEYIINHSEARVFIVEDVLAPVCARANLEKVKTFICINLNGNPLPEAWVDFDGLLADVYPDGEPEVLINGDDMAALLYTSGTEASPKGVMETHLNYYSVLLSVAVDVGMRSDDIFLVSTPLFHVAALAYQSVPTLTFAGTVVLMYSPVINEILDLIERESVTFISFPSTIYMAMAQIEQTSARDLGSVRVAFSFGAPIPSVVMQRCKQLMPRATWINAYGMTELAALGTSNPDSAKPRSIGRPNTPLEMKIVDDNDNEVPRGQTGEILVRGPAVMLGYYKDTDRTEEAFKGGWLHTGDLARMDEDGNIYFVDRKKDIIKTGGENVSSQEVEEAIFKHPKVAEAAVIGVPHDYWMEAVLVAVVPKENETLTEEEVMEHCKGLLAGYKVPKKVVIVESIPKNPSGKMLKRELRQRFSNIFST